MDFHRIRSTLSQEHTLPPNVWKGAVLFLIDEERVVFIKRSEKMPTHGGQIAFVGGHKLSIETDPWVTVQREFGEETGLPAEDLEFLGYLPVVLTARMQPIVPVVARTKIGLPAVLEKAQSNGEWDEILTYPWSEIIKEENWNFAWRHGYTKGPVLFHTIKSGNKSHLLWGATAGMVWDFLRLYFKA